jgi:hypothetical protein
MRTIAARATGSLVLAVLLALAGCSTRLVEPAEAGPDATGGKALKFQRKSLTPTDGGRLIAPTDLRPGDILLSADPGIA